MLFRRIRYRALILAVTLASAAASVPGAVTADLRSAVDMDPTGDMMAPAEDRALLILADASRPGGISQKQPWPASPAAGENRPPAEKEDLDANKGLASAAVIRPLKDKPFALALIAASPVRGSSSRPYSRQSFFKRAPSSGLTISLNETVQWVVLTDGVGMDDQAGQIEHDAASKGESSWQYSVEMIFVPVNSLAVRAALSLDPGEEAFDARELGRSYEQSRIGVSIGLDFRPKDGVLLDIDYARVMKRGRSFAVTGAGADSAFEADGDHPAGDDVVSVSLSIQF